MSDIKTKTYVLKEGVGKHHQHVDGVLTKFEAGDEVQLSDAAYEALKDKFTPLVKEKKEVVKTPEAKPGDNTTGAGASANSTNTAK